MDHNTIRESILRCLVSVLLAAVIPGAAYGGIGVAQVAFDPGKTVVQVADPVAPVDRLKEDWWAKRHQAILAALPQGRDADVVMIGDSITQNYEKARRPDEDFQPTWQTFYAPRRTINLGFSGDTTANVLWRLQHGEVEGLAPKVAIVLIGTNNTGWKKQSAKDTQRGIDAVVADLERRLPSTRILLLGILPSDMTAGKSATDAAINRYLAGAYGENPRVTYLDIGSIFRTSTGALDTGIFYDPRRSRPGGALHPDTIGQRRMAEAIEPTLARLLGVSPRVALADMPSVDTAILPVPRLEIDSYDWYARHHAALDYARQSRPSVVMIGDSITHFWAGQPWATKANGPSSWQWLFGKTPVLNLGFGWDRTQNVLWRLRQGEFDGLRPRWVVINIGTNNLSSTENARANTPVEIVAGIDAIVAMVAERSPTSRIVVMGILPRGGAATDPFRSQIAETNRLLAERFANRPRVTVLDIGARYLGADGALPKELMPDGIHPSEAGYRIWAEALRKVGVGGGGS